MRPDQPRRIRVGAIRSPDEPQTAQPPAPARHSAPSRPAAAGSPPQGCTALDDAGRLSTGLLLSWFLILLFPLTLILDLSFVARLGTRKMRRLYILLTPWVLLPLLAILLSVVGYCTGTARLINDGYFWYPTLGDVNPRTHCRVRAAVICMPLPPAVLL